MTERVKLIWDFRGPNAEHIAAHHCKHLKEFAISEELNNTIFGNQKINSLHSVAFLVVEKEEMQRLREILKPTRGQFYEEE